MALVLREHLLSCTRLVSEVVEGACRSQFGFGMHLISDQTCRSLAVSNDPWYIESVILAEYEVNNLNSISSHLSFKSPFLSHRHAADLASSYSYANADATILAVRQANDGTSALSALIEVSRWKAANRNYQRLVLNSTADIWTSLSIARDQTRSPRERFDAMVRLNGIGAPIASAVLTFIDELQFTIIDWRTWTGLGRSRRTQYSWLMYEDYLEFCQTDARRLGLSLRVYDKALWVIGGKELKAVELS